MSCCCWAAVLLERLFATSLWRARALALRRLGGTLLLLLLGMGVTAASQARAPSVRASQEVSRDRSLSACRLLLLSTKQQQLCQVASEKQ